MKKEDFRIKEIDGKFIIEKRKLITNIFILFLSLFFVRIEKSEWVTYVQKFVFKIF